MGDYKSAYSEASHCYIENSVQSSLVDQERYNRSKAREAAHGDQWKKQPVNLNEICDKFAPGDGGHREGVKYTFEGDRYKIKADMASGYLRIFDKKSKQYVKLDGSTGTLAETHFKILKKKEI